MRSNEILINFRWILTRTPTKLKRYLIQKDEIITQACQVECSNVDPKSIQIHWYMYIILRCSNMFSVFRMTVFLNCYLQDCKYNRSSWEKYFNHSWVYGNFKTFFITRARVDWKQATTYLMTHCMYYVFNKFLQIPEMAQLLKIEFFRHNMAIACSTTLMKFHFHETLYSAVVYHRQNIISKYLDIFSKLLAKRKITRCLMGHMAHLTIFGFLLFHFSEFRKGGVHS